VNKKSSPSKQGNNWQNQLRKVSLYSWHNQEEHLVEAPASSTTSTHRAEMVAISVALQKVVEL